MKLCLQCGKEMKRRVSEGYETFRKRKTCSAKCRMAYVKVNRIGWYGI